MSLDAIAGKIGLALDALAPTDCASMAAVIGVGATAALTEEEITLTASWAPPRRNEFAAGRRCARQALAALGAIAGGDALLPDGEGLPAWPQGFLGSISHSRGVAMAVVAPVAAYSLLGLDLEKTNRLSVAAVRRVVHPLEEGFAGGDQLRASVLFSLKESFYKAQFPRWRTAGNFHDLALEVGWAAGTATVAEMDAHFAPELRDMRFAFRLVDAYVISLCWRQPRESRPDI